MNHIIGIDLGATNVRAGLVNENSIVKMASSRIRSSGTVDEVMQDIFSVADQLMDDSVEAIGIGVPGVVDILEGIVYYVQYIPSWKEVQLKKTLAQRYNKPVFVNNDANCFALGEYHYG